MPNVHDLTIWKEKQTIEVVPYKKTQSKFQKQPANDGLHTKS